VHDGDVSLAFFTRRNNPREEEFARRFLTLFLSAASRFAPEYISVGSRWQRIGTEDIEKIVKSWPAQANISLERRTAYASAVTLSMGRAASGYSLVSFWLSGDFFAVPSNVSSYLSFSTMLYNLLNPTYGYIHPVQDAINMSKVHDAKYGEIIIPINLTKGLPAIYWGNFFGPDYVNLIGKTRLLQTTAYQVVEMSDTGLFLRTTASPLNVDHESQTQIKGQIGQEYFYDWGASESTRS
jgi:hypothetical protein